MTNINIAKLIEFCDFLQQITTSEPGYMHSSCRCFNACMRAFDRKNLPAEAIEFLVFLNSPVMKPGFAQFHRDGSVQIRLRSVTEYE